MNNLQWKIPETFTSCSPEQMERAAGVLRRQVLFNELDRDLNMIASLLSFLAARTQVLNEEDRKKIQEMAPDA